jgi:hypothetical protein
MYQLQAIAGTEPLHFVGISDRNKAGIAQWYSAGLRAGWLGVRAPTRSGNFSLHHRIQMWSQMVESLYKFWWNPVD